MERNDISQVYRMGKVFGKRPLFVSFAKYGAKVDVMKNVAKLKGTSVSISDDLTKTALAKKKFIIGCSNQAKAAGHQVKFRNGSLVISSKILNYYQLKEQGWLLSLNRERDNSLKRPLNESPQDENSFDNQNSRGESQGNEMPPTLNFEEGGMRSR
jgi:hypothetical protein